MNSALVSAPPGAALYVLSLFVVCSLHAAAWTALAVLLVRTTAPRAAVAHALYKLALLGPLLSTALSLVWPTHLRVETAWLAQRGAARTYGADIEASGVAGAAASGWMVEAQPLLEVLALLVLTGCVLGLARFGVSLWMLRRTLRGRVPVRDARLLSRFTLLCARAGLADGTLTESVHASGPLVLGAREICVPSGGLATFRDDEVDAVLAHELAHLARGDGLWFPVVALVEALLWMQPLSGYLARRCRDSAEVAADDGAVALTQAPMALARAITRMAENQLTRRGACLVPTMATAPSTRVRRVQRLVHRELAEARTNPVRWPLPCLGVLVLVMPSLGAEFTPVRAMRHTPGHAIAGTNGAEGGAHRAQMEALAERGAELETELTAAQSESSADAAGLLEREQELRHVRAMQAWLEAGFADAHVAPVGTRIAQ